MASTRRRSGRNVKYKDESSEEEDEDPKISAAKSKLKQLINEDSDADSDFEKDLKEKGVEVASAESSSEDEPIEDNAEEVEEVMKVGKKNVASNSKKKNMPNKLNSIGIVNGGINLSGSESSSDEEMAEVRKKKNMSLGAPQPRAEMRVSSFDEEATDQDNDAASSQTLMALAQNLHQISTAWTDSGAPPQEDIKEEVMDIKPYIHSPVKTRHARKGKSSVKTDKETPAKSSMNDTNLDSISKLLARGENYSEGDGEDSSEDDEPDRDVKKEDIEDHHHTVPKEGIEVTVSLPGKVRKKKKEFDVGAFLKRELSKARHEAQKVMHSAHFVCLVSHLRYVNTVLSDDTLRAAALSIVPAAHTHKPKNITLISLSSIVKWFREFIPTTNIDPDGMKQFVPLRRRVIQVLESYLAMDLFEHVCAFILVCRSLGLDTRLVLNLDVVPLKPPSDDKKPTPKEKVKKESPSPSEKTKSKDATKRKLKGSDSEGDEEEYQKSQPKKSLSSKLAEKKAKECESTKIKSETSKSNTKDAPKENSRGDKSRDKSINKYKDSRSQSKNESKDSRSKSKDESTNSRSRSRPSRGSRDESKDSRSKSNGTTSDTRGRSRTESKDTRSNDKSRSSKVKTEEMKEDSKLKIVDKSKRRSCRAVLEILDRSKELNEVKHSRSKSHDARTNSQRKKESRKHESSDEDFEPSPTPSSSKKKDAKRRKSSGEEFEASPSGTSKASRKKFWASQSTKSKPLPDRTKNYWLEVYLEKDKKWVCVDLETGRINSPTEIESRLHKPIYYILAVDNKGFFKDVTRRYVASYITTTRKLRYDEAWIKETLRKYTQKSSSAKTKQEDLELERKSEDAPMPTTVSGFKSHPLYVLKRHLLKFEAIYPPEAPSIGWCNKEPVYARECVFTLQGRTSWLKEGRTVKIGEEAYKVVTARPKYDRMTGNMVKDLPLEVFGHWQTQIYVPPPAKDGKVPRNEYGNVELFKPWMLPKGTVHIPINGLQRTLRKLNIDAAPAMMGWDFSGRGCHPVYDGYVVCQEFEEQVLDAWNKDQQEREEKAEEKRENRIVDNWRRLVKGLFIREKIQAKYMKKK